MSEKAQIAAARFRSGLGRIYGDRLVDVYVFGSHARGDSDPESDLDVIVVLASIERYADEIDRTSHLAAALSLEHGMSISRVFVAESAWQTGDTTFLKNVRGEAVPA